MRTSGHRQRGLRQNPNADPSPKRTSHESRGSNRRWTNVYPPVSLSIPFFTPQFQTAVFKKQHSTEILPKVYERFLQNPLLFCEKSSSGNCCLPLVPALPCPSHRPWLCLRRVGSSSWHTDVSESKSSLGEIEVQRQTAFMDCKLKFSKFV